MKRRLPFELTKRALTKRIKEKQPNFDDAGRSRTNVLQKAQELGVVGEREFADTVHDNFQTVKCYLWTMLKDAEARIKFDAYVKLWSLIWFRTSATLNLLVRGKANLPCQNRSDIPKPIHLWKPSSNDTVDEWADRFFKNVFQSNSRPTYLRQLILPELFQGRQVYIDELRTVYEENEHLLAHLYPADWETVLSRSGWQQAIGVGASTLRSTIQVKIQTSVRKGVQAYLSQLLGESESRPYLKLLRGRFSLERSRGLDQFYVSHVQDLRKMLGMKDQDALSAYPKLSSQLLRFYFHLHRMGICHGHAMPMGSFDRKFAYFDNVVLRWLLRRQYEEFTRNGRGSESQLMDAFMKHLGFSAENFISTQMKKRRNLRRMACRRRPRDSNDQRELKAPSERNLRVQKQNRATRLSKWSKPKTRLRTGIHPKWTVHGHASLPAGSVLRSFRTDGVAVALYFKRKQDLPQFMDAPRKVKTRAQKHSDKNKGLESSRLEDEKKKTKRCYVGIDVGRAKLYYAAFWNPPADEDRFDDPNQSTDLRFQSYTRSEHYFRMGTHKLGKGEKSMLSRNFLLRMARDRLSNAGQEGTLESYLATHRTWSSVLIHHHIESKYYSFRRMLSYRWKQATLSRAAQRLFDAAFEDGDCQARESRTTESKHLILGIGSGGFPATRKGERPVPVKGIIREIYKAKKRLELSRGVATSVTALRIDEFHTTQCCSMCGVDMKGVRVVNRKMSFKAFRTHT